MVGNWLLSKFKKLIDRFYFRYVVKRNNLSELDLKGVPIAMIETWETILNYITPEEGKSMVLLDIGAHKGYFSKIANEFIDFKHTVCIEPNLKMISEIQINNQNNDNISISAEAFSDKIGSSTYYIHPDSSMNSVLSTNNDILRKEFPYDPFEKIRKQTISTNTLDRYIVENKMEEESFFIKIDTQGNEMSLLKAGLKTLEKTKACLIEYMFLSPYTETYSFEELIAFFHENGFKCQAICSIRKRPSKKVSGVDLFFTRK